MLYAGQNALPFVLCPSYILIFIFFRSVLYYLNRSHVLSEEPEGSEWDGPRGFIGEELIKEKLPPPSLNVKLDDLLPELAGAPLLPPIGHPTID